MTWALGISILEIFSKHKKGKTNTFSCVVCMNQMAHSTFGAHTETTSVHAAYGFRVQETRIALMNYSDISVEKKYI